MRNAYGSNQSEIDLARRSLRDLRFKVVPGSSLSMAKIPKIMMALTLHERGVLDDEDLLDIVDIPNKEKILEKSRMRASTGIPPKTTGGSLPGNMLPGRSIMDREY
jgi:hypothetical protein